MATQIQTWRNVGCAVLLIATSQSVTAQPRFTPGELLVRLAPVTSKPSTAADVAGAIADAAPGLDVTSVEPLLFSRHSRTKPTTLAHAYKVTYEADVPPDVAAGQIAGLNGVVSVQPNHLFRPFQAVNDPRFSEQLLEQLGWPRLRELFGTPARQVIVGIIDSGIEYTHEDLADNIWTNPDEADGIPGVDDDGNGYVDDIRGWDFTDAPSLPGKGDFLDPDNDPTDESSHGTQVAGVVGAVANNYIGVAGVADCLLMAVRAGLSFEQGGTFLQEDDLGAAILYAVDNGAHILNLSWGGPERAFLIEDAIGYATQQGVIVVAATGNTGDLPLAYPAALDGVISVSAVDGSNRIASFSSFGPRIDLAAPGVGIMGTQLDGTYGPRSGTSFAAPHVTGLAAVLLGRHDDWSAEQVRGALVATATDLGSPGWDEIFGAGLIDAAALGEAYASPAAPPPTVRIHTPTNDEGVLALIKVRSSVTGQDVLGYRLSYGEGLQPTSWDLQASGPGSTNDLNTIALPASLTDTTVVLRLEADLASGTTIEDRVVVAARPEAPFVTTLEYGTTLEGGATRFDVRWLTHQPSTGYLLVEEPGRPGVDTLSSNLVDRLHEVTLPEPHRPRTVTFRTLSTSATGVQTIGDRFDLIVTPSHLSDAGFKEVAQLPDGFLSDRAADFNGNGRASLALMPYIEGQAFSPSEIHEWSAPWTFNRIVTSPTAFLPYSAADISGDDAADLLGTTVAQIDVYEDALAASESAFGRTGVWGLGFHDANGDGEFDLLARDGSTRAIHVISRASDGTYKDLALLSDPSTGPGDIGARVVVADLDGDTAVEILAGDGDGDLWVHEAQNSGGFAPTWLREAEVGDARWVGGGADLDGDGAAEFAVARSHEDPNEALNGHWSLEIWGSVGGDQFNLEWSQRISGVLTPGNGVATGDLDGDGLPDLAVCVLPDLYLVRADGPNAYRPFYYRSISLTHRPVISDLDADGTPEVVFNDDGAVRVLERTAGSENAQRPEILRTLQPTPGSVAVYWSDTPGATHFELRRHRNGEVLVVTVANASPATDGGLVLGETVDYDIVAVLSDGNRLTSAPVPVIGGPGSSIVRARALDGTRVAVTFSRPMAGSAATSDAYRLIPDLGRPTSAIQDREGQRVVLTFVDTLIDGQTYTLDVEAERFGIVDIHGGLPVPATAFFTVGSTSTVARADFDDDGVVAFPDFLLFAAAFGTGDPAFDLDADGTVGFSDFLTFAHHFGETV